MWHGYVLTFTARHVFLPPKPYRHRNFQWTYPALSSWLNVCFRPREQTDSFRHLSVCTDVAFRFQSKPPPPRWTRLPFPRLEHNFYGIPANINEHPKDYGIYEFKKGFNGYVEELIGEFELPITWHYKLFKLIHKMRGK